jgi:hypothetical protein
MDSLVNGGVGVGRRLCRVVAFVDCYCLVSQDSEWEGGRRTLESVVAGLFLC